MAHYQNPPPSSDANESNPNLIPSGSEHIEHSLSESAIDPHGNNLRFDESQLICSNHRSFPCHHFNIEVEKLCIGLLQEENEPRNVKEALSNLQRIN